MEALDMSFMSEELQSVVNKGGGNKAPGGDGIGFELFEATWWALKGDMLELFSRMFLGRKLSEQQERGVIVCIPKKWQGLPTRLTSGK